MAAAQGVHDVLAFVCGDGEIAGSIFLF